MTNLSTENLAQIALLQSNTILGAAFKIHLMGGDKLSEKERSRVISSPYLWQQHGDSIMALVDEFKSRSAPESAGG